MALILIIDREGGPADELTRQLEEQGYEVEVVRDSPSTYEFLRGQTPRLVILDLMAAIRGRPAEQPEGVRLLAQLYLDHPEIPLVVYSRSRKYRKQFWSWAAAAHLSKTNGPGPLIDLVDRLLGD
jgi:CheY-like chemotaxis protein